MKQYTKNGILYTEEIVSINGAVFVLFPEDHHTGDSIHNAKEEILYQRDVVSIRIASEDDRDYLYKADVFRHPLQRHLAWFEVNDDPTTIRRERMSGTTTENYIKLFVIPFIEETKEKNIKKYGENLI